MSHDVEMIYALFLWSTYYEMYFTYLEDLLLIEKIE